MSADLARFLPMGGMLAGILVAFAFDPMAMAPVWWAGAIGLVAGTAARFGLKRYYDAR